MAEALAHDDTLQPDVITTPWGQTLSAGDVDGLVGAYERADKVYREARDCRADIAHALLVLTSGEAKTRYVRGAKRRAKVEIGPDQWDQGALMNVWTQHPKFIAGVVRIATLKVVAAEFGKILKEDGPEDFRAFRAALVAANRGPSDTPRITVVGGDA